MSIKTPQHTGGFLKPAQALVNFGLKPGMKAADFGCGHGYFTIPMAKIVGENGQIIAVDVLKASLQAIESQAKLYNLYNIKTVWGDLEKEYASQVEPASLDLVLLANILFQTDNKPAVFKEAIRVLKPSGRVIIIEWRPEAKIKSKKGWFIALPALKDLALKHNLLAKKEFSAGKSHYGLVLVPLLVKN